MSIGAAASSRSYSASSSINTSTRQDGTHQVLPTAPQTHKHGVRNPVEKLWTSRLPYCSSVALRLLGLGSPGGLRSADLRLERFDPRLQRIVFVARGGRHRFYRVG